jgi:uncharacterized oxidoreductase
MNLAGKRTLVTGGGSGIGFELARRLAAAGADVVIAGRDEAKLERARAAAGSLRTIRLDVTSEPEAGAALDWMASELGGLDLLVNSAGVMHPGRLDGASAPSTTADELAINLGGTIRMTRLALPMLEASPEAAVVLMSSGVALAAVPGLAVYTATKAALHSFARSLRGELADRRIRVVEVLPPVVDTGLAGALQVPKTPPSSVAAAIISGVERDRSQIAVGAIRPLIPLARIAPGLTDRLVRRALGPLASG